MERRLCSSFSPSSSAAEFVHGDVTPSLNVIFPAKFSGENELALGSRDVNFSAKFSGET